MDFNTFNKVNVASAIKNVSKAKFTGTLEISDLTLFNIIGYLLFNNIYRTFEEKSKLEFFLIMLQNRSSKLCKIRNFKSTFFSVPNTITFNNVNDLYYGGIVSGNDAPVITNIASTEANSFYFDNQTFVDHFTDVNNDELSKLCILTLPTHGALELLGVPIVVNQEIDVDSIDLIKYTQTEYSTTDTFTFKCQDNNTNPLYSNMATFTINIVEPINLPPSLVGEFDLSVDNLELYEFTADNFTTDTTPVYADPELDDAYKIKFTSLPKVGELKYNGILVTVNQEVLLSNLATIALTYSASLPQGSTGDTDSFNFSLSDTGSQLFTTGGSVNITIGAYINQPPTSGNYNDVVDEGEILTITSVMLTTFTTPPYSDPENNPPLNLKVTSLPTAGLLKLNGINVIDEQVISFTDIDNNLLTYVQDPDAGGTSINFGFLIQDTLSGQFG